MALTPRSVFRYYETDGVPSSGKHEPIKAEIIQLLEQLFGTSRGGWIVARTKTELDGITPESETDGGVVLTGTDAGYYDRDGGAWVFGRGFPDTFARVELSGSGTAQTGTVATGVVPSTIEVFFAFVGVDNTGPLTLSIAGEPPREVVNLASNPLAAGEWTGTVMFARDGAQYRLLLDAGAAASAAQSASDANADRIAADAAADSAAASAAAAGAASGRLVIGAFSELETKFVYSAPGSGQEVVANGDVITWPESGFAYKVLATGATDDDIDYTGSGGVKLRVLPDTENSISTTQFGIQDASPGPVTQAAFEAAVIAARENGYRLISPEGSDIRLIDTVDVRAVHLDLRGRIYGENLVPVLVMGGYNTIRNNPEQRVFEVSNGLDRDNPAIQVKGFRGSVMHIRRCLSVQLYADSDSSEGGQEAVTGGNSVSIAYNHFFFVDVHALELTNNPDTDGTTTQWINANTFFCRRLSRLRINGTYSHNDNTFITPNFEGAGAEIDIENGSMNKIYDARFENLGPAPIVKFGPTSRRNIITYSWMPTLEDLRIPDSFWRDGYVEIAEPEGGFGNGNVVKNTLLANETRHRIFEFSAGSCMVLSNDNGTASACDLAIMSVGVAGFNTVSRVNNSIIARIPDYIPFPPNARLQVYGDGGNNFRCNVQFFDANHTLITSEPDVYAGGGTTWDAGESRLLQSGNNGQYGLLNADPDVAFIKLDIVSNNTNARFSNLAAYVYTDGPELVDTLSQWDMGKRSAGLVFSGTAPTRGLPQHGQIVGIRSGGYHQCTFRNSVATTAPASSGGGSISVPSGHGASNGDVIGIEYDGDNAHWTTVSGTSGTSISLTDNLPANITAGARVELVRWVTST